MKKRSTEEQIIGFLREAEAGVQVKVASSHPSKTGRLMHSEWLHELKISV
ncbi:MAG: hypothetical protein J0H95_03050 [Xanthomonadales bacterium]|jgi:hypothetical protein|nr:hypothetical protein [Thermomonas alba]MBN8715939.1 hypothetical protein [Xanthomonadales bacterium]MBN8794178.1 hypothetical protein [Stenotrophomonas nitritireducens]